jgi:uncharacterized membrane protein YcaP (DUF421 family)
MAYFLTIGRYELSNIPHFTDMEALLGLHAHELALHQMLARAVIVFIASLGLIRVAGLRTFGKQSAFDEITSLMMGAILGRSIVAAQPFFESLGAALLIMLMHRFVAWLSFRNKIAGKFLKGDPLVLFRKGKFYRKNLIKSHITEDDVSESLRLKLNINDLQNVEEVFLERSGEVSVVKSSENHTG